MAPEKLLLDLRKLLLENNEKVGELEMTTGNYEDEGKLIEESIPTITTDFCEIGAYGNVVYFVFIIYSESYTKKLFDHIKDISGIKIYGFDDFKTILYPKAYFDYKEFEEVVKKDKYLQFQFKFDLSSVTTDNLVLEYKKLKDVFVESGAETVNQLEINLVK